MPTYKDWIKEIDLNIDYFSAFIKEALIKSTCADLRQKFLLTRKKIAGILTDFKIF